MRLPAHGDNIDAAVASEVGCRQVFHGDAATDTQHLRPSELARPPREVKQHLLSALL